MKWLYLLSAIILTGNAVADVRLPAVISDHAMLQAGKPIVIWGWAEPNAQVKVAFVTVTDSSCDFSATADAKGEWSGRLPAQKTGTAGRLDVTSDKGGSKTVNDVLIGEVWLGSGQSNIAYVVGGSSSVENGAGLPLFPFRTDKNRPE
jgi:sialate O-acetylesterase